jgi:hypothetical protein
VHGFEPDQCDVETGWDFKLVMTDHTPIPEYCCFVYVRFTNDEKLFRLRLPVPRKHSAGQSVNRRRRRAHGRSTNQ